MSGKNADLNTADNDIQPSQLAADHGNTGTATSESGKASVLNRRTLGATVRVLVGGHFIFHFRR